MFDLFVRTYNIRARARRSQLGGGVSSVDAILTARSCQVTENSATRDGGGLRVSYQTTAVLDACDVSFNTGEKLLMYLY